MGGLPRYSAKKPDPDSYSLSPQGAYSRWDVSQPGFMEADTVAHCGNSLAGDFVWSLTMTDILTTWTENRATWGKGAEGVLVKIKDVEARLPFTLQGSKPITHDFITLASCLLEMFNLCQCRFKIYPLLFIYADLEFSLLGLLADSL